MKFRACMGEECEVSSSGSLMGAVASNGKRGPAEPGGRRDACCLLRSLSEPPWEMEGFREDLRLHRSRRELGSSEPLRLGLPASAGWWWWRPGMDWAIASLSSESLLSTASSVLFSVLALLLLPSTRDRGLAAGRSEAAPVEEEAPL